MKKKMLSFAMALILCCTFLQGLPLSKTVYAEGVNITPYGNFDTENDVLLNTAVDYSKITWVDDGNGGGYLSTTPSRAWMGTKIGTIPIVAGEIYDIYFDVKTADGETDTMYSTGLEAVNTSYSAFSQSDISPSTTITGDWQTYHMTMTVKDNAEEINPNLSSDSFFLRIRRTAGSGAWLDIDNVEVYPRGNSTYDWEGYANSLWGEMESFDADDGFEAEKAEGGTAYMSVYVDGDNGSDDNAGTENAPLKTIGKAKEKIQSSLSNMTGHIYVYIKGNINLSETLYWETKDSGQNGYNVVYTSWGDAQPEITMKNDFSDFSLYDADKNIYRTYVGKDQTTRQVYVNGVRAVRAKSDDLTKHSLALANASKVATSDGLYYMSADVELADYERQDQIEFVYTTLWTNSRVLVDNIYKVGDDQVRIDMNKESWARNTSLANQSVVGKYPTWIENAYGLLDAPGEWYINNEDGYLYYKPRAYEDPETMVATLPYGEQAFVVAGDSTGEKIHNIVFDNLAFKYITWLYPNEIGLRDEQAMFFGAYKGDGRTTGGTADAAVTVLDAAYVDITNCTFSHLGGTGIFYTEVFQKCEVLGNHIYDISASGIIMGHNTRQEKEYTKYYRPTKYVNYLIENKINNNLVHDIGVDYMSAPGITISLLINSEVKHNEIYNINYTGLHIGWGWNAYNYGKITSNQGNEIMYNYIHDTMQTHLYDGGGIYVLGHTGGRNDIAYNYLENHRNGHGAVYFDEGSDRWHMYNNVIDLKEIIEWPIAATPNWVSGGPFVGEYTEYGKIYDNYSTTIKYKTSTEWQGFFSNAEVYEAPALYGTGAWPTAAQEIVDAAGLESEYLTKYPDSVQRLRVLNEKQNEYFLEDGATMQLDVAAYTRKLAEESLSDTEITYYSSDEGVATVSESGLITAVGNGKCAVYAEYLDGDIIRRKHVNISTHLPLKEIVCDFETVAVTVGQSMDLAATGKTIYGGEESVIPTATFDYGGIATVKNGVITGVSAGKTVMHLTYSSGGVNLLKDVTVYVTKYNNGSTSLTHASTSLNPTIQGDFFQKANWSGNITQTSSGLSVKGTTHDFMPAYYKNEVDTVSFDVKVNSPMSWPSFVVGAEDVTKNYKDNCYLITLKSDCVELYRFNDGERTVIFGSNIYERIGGDAYSHSSLYKYGTKFSVTVGTKNTGSGTNIVLIINGTPVFDYTDTDSACVTGKHFGIYEWSGNFELSAYTGITK